MKKIENKPTSIVTVENGEQKPMSYVDLLKVVMDAPPAQGYTISEMRQRLKIYAALTPNEENKIELEDADFVVVKKCVAEFKWAKAHNDIVAFVDHIESL